MEIVMNPITCLELLRNIDRYYQYEIIYLKLNTLGQENVQLLITDDWLDNGFWGRTYVQVEDIENLAQFYQKYYQADLEKQAQYLNFYLKNGYHDLPNLTISDLVEYFELVYNEQDTTYAKRPWNVQSRIWLFNDNPTFYSCENDEDVYLGEHYKKIKQEIVKKERLEYFLELHVMETIWNEESENLDEVMEDIIEYAENDA